MDTTPTEDGSSTAPRGVPDESLVGLVYKLADAVIIADTKGDIVVWNDAATALFGWTAEDATGRTLDIIIPERFRDRHWTGYSRVMETGVSVYGSRLLEVPALHRDGTTLSIAFTVTVMRANDGTIEGIAAVVRDETERRAELQRLRGAQATS